MSLHPPLAALHSGSTGGGRLRFPAKGHDALWKPQGQAHACACGKAWRNGFGSGAFPGRKSPPPGKRKCDSPGKGNPQSGRLRTQCNTLCSADEAGLIPPKQMRMHLRYGAWGQWPQRGRRGGAPAKRGRRGGTPAVDAEQYALQRRRGRAHPSQANADAFATKGSQG